MSDNNLPAKSELLIESDVSKNTKFSSDDETFMRRAIALADLAQSHNEIPVGAVLVHNGKIIGEGFNQSIMNNDPSAHAEMMAIRDAGKNIANYRLLDCTLYVTLEPCCMCAGLLVHSRIKQLVFASKDLKTGAAGSAFALLNHQQHNHQVEVRSGLFAEECSTMLSAFFKRRRAEKKAEKQAKRMMLSEPNKA